MKIDSSRGTFEEIIAGSSQAVMEIAYDLRNRIAALYPDVTEIPRPAERHADYGIGSEKMVEVFAYLCPLKDYVRLGFFYGAALSDPGKLMIGGGKRLRHIKIYTLAEAGRPEIEQLIRAAVVERQQALGKA